MRDLEYEREKEEERKRKRKKEEEKKRLKAKAELEKKRREKAEKTIREQARALNWLLKEFPFHPGVFHMWKPGSKDKVEITVFEDGRVRVDSPGVISPQNHPSMDAFMANLKDTLKGTWRTVKQYVRGADAHTHAHQHGHAHTH